MKKEKMIQKVKIFFWNYFKFLGDDSTKEPSKLNVANQQMNELSQPSAPILDDDNSLEHAERILNRVKN